MNAVRILVSAVWLILVMAGAYFGKDVFVDTETPYSGTPVVLTLGQQEALAIEGVTDLEASSENHFILRAVRGRYIESRYTPPSFGNRGDNHTVAVEDLPSDSWEILEGGPVDIQLKAENGVQAEVQHSQRQVNVDYFFFYCACFSALFAGMWIIWRLFRSKEKS